MKFGYARVSTKSQKHDLQVDAFLKEGIKPKNIYADISSGAKAERKGLDELLSILREGDTLSLETGPNRQKPFTPDQTN